MTPHFKILNLLIFTVLHGPNLVYVRHYFEVVFNCTIFLSFLNLAVGRQGLEP